MIRLFTLLVVLMCVSALSAFESPQVTYKGEPGPVTFGVPFKQGALKDPSSLYLNGNPLQVKVNARWQDNSVKWALFDTELPANFKGKFTQGKVCNEVLLYRNGDKGVSRTYKSEGEFLINNGHEFSKGELDMSLFKF